MRLMWLGLWQSQVAFWIAKQADPGMLECVTALWVLSVVDTSGLRSSTQRL